MSKIQHVKKSRILLVDDDRLILATLSKGLEQAGYDVLQATSGDLALKIAIEQDPDLAVLDIRMPQMSGIELAQHLGHQSTVPFMFFSAYGDMNIAKQAAQFGAVGYLVKPIDTAHMIPAIEAGLARGAEIKQLRRILADLTVALTAGRETSVAIGLMMERHRIDRVKAFEALRGYARRQRRKVNDIASDLIKAEELLNLPMTEWEAASQTNGGKKV